MIKVFQVDAFTKEKFRGNPAGVCILNQDIDPELMQDIAAEMNLSETAFVRLAKDEPDLGLRWFTPTVEVDLCGHATLATAHVLLTNGYFPPDTRLIFTTLSGKLTARAIGGAIQLDFPLIKTQPVEVDPVYEDIFQSEIIAAASVEHDLVLELASSQDLKKVEPDIDKIKRNSDQGIIITARGEGEYDFLTRYFVPNVGIDEDPVTGYAHCVLSDYWSKKLNQDKFKAYQASKRGGELELEVRGNRVLITGKAVTVFETELDL